MNCPYFNVTFLMIILPSLISQFGGKHLFKGWKIVTIDGIPVMNHRLTHDLQQIAQSSRNAETLQSLAPSTVQQTSGEWLGLESSFLAKFVSSFSKVKQLKSSWCLPCLGIVLLFCFLLFTIEAWTLGSTLLTACVTLLNYIVTTPGSPHVSLNEQMWFLWWFCPPWWVLCHSHMLVTVFLCSQDV